MAPRVEASSAAELLDAGTREVQGPNGAAHWVGATGPVAAAEGAGPSVPEAAGSRPERAPARTRVRRALAAVLLVALAVTWTVTLRPQVLGGPVSYVKVVTSAMAPTVPRGDVVVTKPQSVYRPGDVVVYRSSGSSATATALVVGRVEGGSALAGYVVTEDAAVGPDQARPPGSQVVGKVWFGFASTWLGPMAIGFGVVFLGLVMAAWPPRRSRRRPSGVQPVS